MSSGVTRRTVLTADGTLYGVSSDYEMKKLASDVKQAGMGHYLTNKGEVKEINSGKTIAADCKAFAEHRYGRVIGVLKNDGSFSMGYTYLGEQEYYEKGLVYAKKDNVTTIVPGGICTKDKTFYRWVEDVRIGGYTMDPATGSFSQSYTLELKLNLVTKMPCVFFLMSIIQDNMMHIVHKQELLKLQRLVLLKMPTDVCGHSDCRILKVWEL